MEGCQIIHIYIYIYIYCKCSRAAVPLTLKRRAQHGTATSISPKHLKRSGTPANWCWLKLLLSVGKDCRAFPKTATFAKPKGRRRLSIASCNKSARISHLPQPNVYVSLCHQCSMSSFQDKLVPSSSSSSSPSLPPLSLSLSLYLHLPFRPSTLCCTNLCPKESQDQEVRKPQRGYRSKPSLRHFC